MSFESASQASSSSSTVPVPGYFNRARNVTIGAFSNFSTVHGNQNIYYNQEQKKATRYIVGTQEEEAEYEQFPEVLRSQFIAFQNICSHPIGRYDRWDPKWMERGRRTVVAGELASGGGASKCLTVLYSGERAEEAWKEDFGQFGGIRCPDNAQLVAINLSSVPMLVLIGDLVPLAHLVDRVGRLGQLYFKSLAEQMDCWQDDLLWMDTSRGVFCRGPKGPYWIVEGTFSLRDLPSDAELVKEDVLLQYLISSNQVREVVNVLSLDWEFGTRLEVNRLTVISTLTDTILAIGSGVWKEGRESCLGEREELANGATRFSLLHNKHWLELKFNSEESLRDWLAQALSVFHAHGISLEGDMHEYKLILPEILTGWLSDSEAQQRRREESPPIYLFIPPLSTSTFWSFDPDGQNPITTDLCHHLGLPISLKLNCYGYCWRTEIYKALRTCQIARGFDPNTNEFARHNGYPIYKIVEQPFSSCFEEIESSEPTETPLHPEDISPGAPSGDVQLEDSTMNAATQGHVLQKGATYSPDYPNHNQPSTPHSDFTDSACIDNAEIDCTLSRDLVSISPTREIIPVETKDAFPPKHEQLAVCSFYANSNANAANVWSRFIPGFSWAALEDSDRPSAGF